LITIHWISYRDDKEQGSSHYFRQECRWTSQIISTSKLKRYHRTQISFVCYCQASTRRVEW
jgi:hypothetical protein